MDSERDYAGPAGSDNICKWFFFGKKCTLLFVKSGAWYTRYILVL